MLGEGATSRQVAPMPDTRYLTWLEGLSEYRPMRGLSAGYRLVEVRDDPSAMMLICQDLRTRNFEGKLGRLGPRFDPDGRLKPRAFHA